MGFYWAHWRESEDFYLTQWPWSYRAAGILQERRRRSRWWKIIAAVTGA